MGTLKYKQASLFEAPKGSILIHACNCQGVWGSGIAKEFAVRFPEAYREYQLLCQKQGASLLGTCTLIPATNYMIACLFTSKNYGKFVDNPSQILVNTKTAVEELINKNTNNLELNTCKINSGLFKVPWNETEKILASSKSNFTIYDLIQK